MQSLGQGEGRMAEPLHILDLLTRQLDDHWCSGQISSLDHWVGEFCRLSWLRGGQAKLFTRPFKGQGAVCHTIIEGDRWMLSHSHRMAGERCDTEIKEGGRILLHKHRTGGRWTSSYEHPAGEEMNLFAWTLDWGRSNLFTHPLDGWPTSWIGWQLSSHDYQMYEYLFTWPPGNKTSSNNDQSRVHQPSGGTSLSYKVLANWFPFVYTFSFKWSSIWQP